MAVCELTGKGPVVKNLVSHSNIKTKTPLHVNVQYKRLYSRVLGRAVTLKIATTTLRSLEKAGGFDAFLLQQPQENLSRKAFSVRTAVLKKLRKGSKAGKNTEKSTEKLAAKKTAKK